MALRILLRSSVVSKRGIASAAARAPAASSPGGREGAGIEEVGLADADAAAADGEGADALASTHGVAGRGARVFRRQRQEHQRVFRWGVGNRFRMENKNRFMPVHKPHPKEVTVRDDYYKSENANVRWENMNEAWEVYWYENRKLNAKPFPVKKFGIERAKVEAFAFYEELLNAGRLHERPRHEQPQAGVFYDSRMQSWVSLFWRDNRPLSRSFAAAKYGFEGAKSLAVAQRNDPVNGILPAHPGGGTPISLKRLARLGRSLS